MRPLPLYIEQRIATHDTIMLTEYFLRAVKTGAPRPLEPFCRNYRVSSHQELPTYYSKIQVVGWIYSHNLNGFPNLHETLKRRIYQLQCEEAKILPEADLRAFLQTVVGVHALDTMVKAIAINELTIIKHNISLLEKEKNACLQLLYWMFGPNSQKMFLKKSQSVRLCSCEMPALFPLDCRADRAKEMIALLFMRLKVRYYQLFHRPKEYEWFIPPKTTS